MKFWASIAAFFAALLTPIAAWLKGGQDARRKRKVRDLQDEIETRDRMDQAEAGNDPNAAAEWLRQRQRARDLQGD